MALPFHDCTRQVELISFIEKEKPQAKSGWFLDRYFRTRTTMAEKLEFRRYQKGDVCPLHYTGACEPPNRVKLREQMVQVEEMSWPTIKAETQVNGCDVDDHRVSPDGRNVLMPGRGRYDNAVNWAMMGLMDSLRATHIQESIDLLRNGSYVLHTDANGGTMGTVDFKREDSLANIDITDVTGTEGSWTDMCAKPLRFIEAVLQEKARCQGISGATDIIYSPLAWEWMQAHEEREAIKYHMPPSVTSQGFNEALFTSYSDVQFKGQTNGGQLLHWVSAAMYKDYDGVVKPVLAPGEIMIVNRGGFDGQRIFRTVTSDNAEQLPSGTANPWFMYDDPTSPLVYDPKCRGFKPWLEEYHLMVPGNVNGACVIKVVPEDSVPCVVCEKCVEPAAAEKVAA